MTLNYRSKKYLDMTLAQRLEYDIKCAGKPPTTELQKLAQKENFALFQLAAMKSNLIHLQNCGIWPLNIGAVRKNLVACERQIKANQELRKNQRESK